MVYIVFGLLAVSGFVYLIQSMRNKKEIKPIVLSTNWVSLLEEEVSFYKELSKEDKASFQQRMLAFFDQVKITGVGCEVEELDYVLIGASAIIPVFRFPNWIYLNLEEVLLRPEAFNRELKNNEERDVAGMVGEGFLNDKMILSKASLRKGFQAQDSQNVGIHEFVHLVDGVDGVIDGIPEVLMTKSYVMPWLNMIYTNMKEMRNGESEIDLYGLTNKQEFLAVVSEYFFEQPEQLQKKHPELYEMLVYFYSSKD